MPDHRPFRIHKTVLIFLLLAYFPGSWAEDAVSSPSSSSSSCRLEFVRLVEWVNPDVSGKDVGVNALFRIADCPMDVSIDGDMRQPDRFEIHVFQRTLEIGAGNGTWKQGPFFIGSTLAPTVTLLVKKHGQAGFWSAPLILSKGATYRIKLRVNDNAQTLISNAFSVPD